MWDIASERVVGIVVRDQIRLSWQVLQRVLGIEVDRMIGHDVGLAVAAICEDHASTHRVPLNYCGISPTIIDHIVASYPCEELFVIQECYLCFFYGPAGLQDEPRYLQVINSAVISSSRRRFWIRDQINIFQH